MATHYRVPDAPPQAAMRINVQNTRRLMEQALFGARSRQVEPRFHNAGRTGAAVARTSGQEWNHHDSGASGGMRAA